jgi:hypothetical protein
LLEIIAGRWNEGRINEDGGPLYSKLESPGTTDVSVSVRNDLRTKMQTAFGVVALHLDFVAKPDGTRELNRELGVVLKDAALVREGLETGLLLVSDREARLVTLLTFWDARRFAGGRERRIAWMQKLLAPYADGPIRAQTSMPRFVLAEAPAEFMTGGAAADGAAEFAQAAS